MKTTFKRSICLSLSVLMTVCLFAGCEKEPVSSPTDVVVENVVTPLDREPVEDTTTAVSKEESDPSSSKKPVSLENESSNTPSEDEVVLLPIDPVDKKPPSTPSKEEPKPINVVFQSVYGEQYTGETGLGKLWKDHFLGMAKKGVVTSFAGIDPDTAVDTITKDVMAGRAPVDVYEVSLTMSHQLAVKRVLANVASSTTLNQKAFNNGGTHSNTINGKTYGVSLSANTDVMMILYNKEYIKQYAPDVDIPTLISQNKWNFDTFGDLAKKCTLDTDGDKKTEIYGVTAGTQLIRGVLFAGAGGYAVERQGKITSTLAYQGEGCEAILFAKTLFKQDRTWLYRAKVETQWQTFSAQEAAMIVFSSREIADYAQKVDFEYGIVPIPTKDQETAYYGVMDAQVFVVPKTKENRLDDIGEWLNGVAKAENTMLIKKTYGLHNDAVTMIQWILRNTSAEYSAGAIDAAIVSHVDALVTSAAKTPFPNQIKPLHWELQNQLDTFYAPLYEN